VTDLLIEGSEALAPGDLPQQEVRATVRRITPLAPGVQIVDVQTPRTQTLRFMAGQRVDLTTEDGQRVRLPVASCPCDARNLQFFVRGEPGDALIDALHGKPRGTVLINGPFGDFLLEEESDTPAIFLAVDDGIGPIKSLVEHAIAIDRAATLHLLRSDDLPPGSHIGNLCRSWNDALDNFTYSRLPSALSPQKAVGELVDRFPSLGNYDLYIAAPAAWLEGFRAALPGAAAQPHGVKLEAVA
jgi:CDP-4-dehydro-6-deoxyglucose reductase